jgi:hypothetical protein
MAIGQSLGSPMTAIERGTRLRCQKCGAEVEIIKPCSCDPPDLILKCCGQDMTPTTPTES